MGDVERREARHPNRANVVLTGFMGTGKSTTGRMVAGRLAMAFVDTDDLIEERHGPIAQIFTDRGERGFRAIERAVAAELAGRAGTVISTGGGLMLDPANAEVLSRTGHVFCLAASVDEILARVIADAGRVNRPLLAVADPAGRISELLAERADVYGQFLQVETGSREPAEVAQEIIDLVASANAQN